MRRIPVTMCAVLALMTVSIAAQSIGQLSKGVKRAQQVNDLIFTDAEEQSLGQQVSDKLRVRFGVVQSAPVHKYVGLVGTVLAQASSRPTLTWKFIVLDTDGVNAYASPGGFIHITRGALALLENESELADVLGHEIAHVTGKHTVRSIQKATLAEIGSQELARTAVIALAADKAYDTLFQGAFNRGDELDADEKGIALANKAGYAPGGLGAFLTRLAERNKGMAERNGLFASHPETTERIDKLAKQITKDKLNATATVAARYKATITYKPVAITAIAQVADGASGLTGSTKSDSKAADTKAADAKGGGSKFGGIAKLNPIGAEKKSTSTVASAGARGGVPDRDAKGGSNPAVITITLTATEITDFKKGIVA